MTSPQIQVRPFEVGDEVFVPAAQDGTDIKVSYAASIIDLNSISGIHVRSTVANADGEFEEDWVDAADLTLVSEPSENTARVEEAKPSATTATFRLPSFCPVNFHRNFHQRQQKHPNFHLR